MSESEVKVQGLTAQEHRAEAKRSYERVEESWERSDTDGFLSQWASGLTGQLHQRNAEIAENGGRASFRVLVDEAGEVVPSKGVQTRYGYRRVTLDEAGNFCEFFSTGDRAAAKRGYRYADVEHPAVAKMDGSGHGLSGNAWVATKPVCEECNSFLDAVGVPCRCGHLTGYTVLSEEASDDA